MREKMFRLCCFVVPAVLVFLGTARWGVAAMRPFLISAVHFDAELKSGKMSVLDLAPLAAKYGAQGVEYRDIYRKDKAKELPAVRDQAAALKLLVTYTTVATLYSSDTQKQARLLADIEDAKGLNAQLLRVNLGIPPTAGPETAGQREAARKAIERASRLGVKLALENNSAAPGERLSDIKATLEEFNSPVLGSNIDFANYVVTGQDPLNAIQTLAPGSSMSTRRMLKRRTRAGRRPIWTAEHCRLKKFFLLSTKRDARSFSASSSPVPATRKEES